MKKLVFALFASAPFGVSAHPGHGAATDVAGYSLLHYVSNAEHFLAVAATAAAVAGAWRCRRLWGQLRDFISSR